MFLLNIHMSMIVATKTSVGFPDVFITEYYGNRYLKLYIRMRDELSINKIISAH